MAGLVLAGRQALISAAIPQLSIDWGLGMRVAITSGSRLDFRTFGSETLRILRMASRTRDQISCAGFSDQSRESW